MTEIEFQFFSAAVDLVARQQELLPLVASAIGVDPFDYWILGQGRGDPAIGSINHTENGEWSFYFHGLEFDIKNRRDGRMVRVDFGPRGRRAFTSGGVGEFVCRSRHPWPTFSKLKDHLCGSHDYADNLRCVELADGLVKSGHFAVANPVLLQLIAKHTRYVPGRGQVLDIPASDMPDEQSDLILCDKLVLTEKQVARPAPTPV